MASKLIILVMKSLNHFFAIFQKSIKSNNFHFKVKKTKFIMQILQSLLRHRYLLGVRNLTNNYILVFFKLNFQKTKIIIKSFKRISTLARRFYFKAFCIPEMQTFMVLSTPKGVLTAKEARTFNVGGEILFKLI